MVSIITDSHDKLDEVTLTWKILESDTSTTPVKIKNKLFIVQVHK